MAQLCSEHRIAPPLAASVSFISRSKTGDVSAYTRSAEPAGSTAVNIESPSLDLAKKIIFRLSSLGFEDSCLDWH